MSQECLVNLVHNVSGSVQELILLRLSCWQRFQTSLTELLQLIGPNELLESLDSGTPELIKFMTVS